LQVEKEELLTKVMAYKSMLIEAEKSLGMQSLKKIEAIAKSEVLQADFILEEIECLKKALISQEITRINELEMLKWQVLNKKE
jgi:hypothetical protein